MELLYRRDSKLEPMTNSVNRHTIAVFPNTGNSQNSMQAPMLGWERDDTSTPEQHDRLPQTIPGITRLS
jgi:hypothetical protein